MADLFSSPAVYGGAGAFIYAAPRLLACLRSPKDHGDSVFSCSFEFIIALTIGAIGAGAFAPWLAGVRGMTEPRDLNAIAVIIGLMANPTAPTIITFAPRMASTILAAMRGPKADEP